LKRVAILALLGACSGASSDEGLGADLRVEGAQFVPGELPAPSGGPAVITAFLPRANVHVGEVGLPLGGTLDPGTNGVAVGLAGDAGYWIVPSSVPDSFDPTHPTIRAEADFSRVMASGDYDLTVIGLDEGGAAGEPFVFPIAADDTEVPEGRVVFTLRWDTATDLDLRVVTPDGIEVWRRNVNSYEAPGPGEPPDPPGAWMSGGILDADSNGACVIDGRDEENVVWTVPPETAGTYVVRVDAYSLCGQPVAPWIVEARVDGEVVGSASGWATSEDARLPHDTGAGVHALDVDVPDLQ
jgi:hypothetical protein